MCRSVGFRMGLGRVHSGYGNRSRSDDGVGWFVVDRLQELALPGVELLTSHQLEVDHAEIISRFDAVVFVDAAIPQSPLAISRTVVKPNFQSHAVAHYLTPGDVLELAKIEVAVQFPVDPPQQVQVERRRQA
jgi:hydrogenase maturation protease